ncbi:MAG: WG repeat-containing protein [Clostridia bacterium]|nr:WG repeat-containing protein [Clostridia bacterium]
MKKICRILCAALAALMCVSVIGCGKKKQNNKKASEYDYMSQYDGGTIGYIVSEEGKYGIIDAKGNYIVEPTFERIFSTLSENLLIAQKDQKLVYIDMKGNVIIETDADVLDEFYDGAAACCYLQKDTETYTYSYISKTTGAPINDTVYYSTKAFSEGCGVCCDNETHLYGYVKADGKYLIKPQYQAAGSFHSGLAPVYANGKWGFINKDGTFVIAPAYDNVSVFGDDGLCRVCIDKKWGYIDTTGKTVIEPRYTELNEFSEGYAVVYDGTAYGVIDKTGKYIIEPAYDNIYPCSEGYFAVFKDGKWGFADTAGKIVIDLSYYFVSSFSEGVALVQKDVDSLCGYIDKTGKQVIAPSIKTGGYFRNGLAVAQSTDELYGVIDKTGSFAVPAKYTSIIEILIEK